MNASGGKPAPDSLYVRPVVEEFKAFVQHKIEVLEKFRNVDEIKVYLDALELGVKSILDIQAEDVSDLPRPAEVEFTGDSSQAANQGAGQPEAADPEVLVEEEEIPIEDAETGPGIETEELETQEGVQRVPDQGQDLKRGGDEVLVGEDKPVEPDSAGLPAGGASTLDGDGPQGDGAESLPATEKTGEAERAGDGPEVQP